LNSLQFILKPWPWTVWFPLKCIMESFHQKP